MNPSDIARLMSMGLAQPSGANDTGLYTGIVESWDDLNGLNAVNVNGVTLSNLRVITSGIGVSYSVGDSVMVERKGTQYFIMGKITAPGSGFANQIVSQDVTASDSVTSTSYGNVSHFGPEVVVNIGPSERVLMFLSASLTAGTGTSDATFSVVRMSFTATGSSSMNAGYTEIGTGMAGGAGVFLGSRTTLLTRADGIREGQTTFTAKYRKDNTNYSIEAVASRNITVIPL
jgi:hypothetical protein